MGLWLYLVYTFTNDRPYAMAVILLTGVLPLLLSNSF